MIDVKRIEENPEKIAELLKRKLYDEDFSEFLEKNKKRKEITRLVEENRAKQNEISKKVPLFKKEGKDVKPLFDEVKRLSKENAENEELLKKLNDECFDFLKVLPNLPDEDLLAGGKENNKPIYTYKEKPVFFIYDAMALPEDFIPCWNKLAHENGLKGICFIGRITNDNDYDKVLKKGFSYVSFERMNDVSLKKTYLQRRMHQIFHLLRGRPRHCYTYKEAYPYFIRKGIDDKPLFIPMLIPCWDHSPRSKSIGLILHNSTPELFRKHIKQVFNLIKKRSEGEQIVFLKSWNEWAEGNYMEPDLKWGKDYIRVLGEEVKQYEVDEL